MENRVVDSMLALIGNTPMLRMHAYEKEIGASAAIYAKLESFNPAGSAKDRVGISMLCDAEERGLIQPGATIVEPTSGNTGIGLAFAAAIKGYRVILTMPDTMSLERRRLLTAYGAELVLTEGAKGMKGAIAKAEELVAATPGAWMPKQFDNPANAAAHERTTGPEIYDALGDQPDFFIAGVGTGGTLTGTGRYLKKMVPKLQIIAVEPADSPLLSGGEAGAHKLQGIGANFIPSVLDTSLYQEVMTVTTEQAYETVRRAVHTEGLLMGVSGGAALYSAGCIACRPENAGKSVVVIIPDTGERYISTDGLFT